MHKQKQNTHTKKKPGKTYKQQIKVFAIKVKLSDERFM